MTDNMNKSIDNEELDLDQLENVSGGALNALTGAAAVNALTGATGVAGAANASMACKKRNEAAFRSSMNSTPTALAAILQNSDNMLDNKK
jgi:lactobin A/cerein 7B family class IIb bacteriocin